MVNSQNGYPVLDGDTTGRHPRLRKWVMNLDRDSAFERHLMLRDGSCGFLLIHFALWFDDTIERLDSGVWDEWGWAPRPIRNSSTPSNHGSGTADDLNATRHPLGVPTRNTFTNKQIGLIHQRLRFYKGCIRWGGDYRNRPDAMHYEIDRGLAAVEKRAKELMKTARGQEILRDNPGAKAVILS